MGGIILVSLYLFFIPNSMKQILVIAILMGCSKLSAQRSQNDSLFIRKIYQQALTEGKAYADLYDLCKRVGARLSGSPQAQMAVQWGYQKLISYGFDTVFLQPIMVPRWERGTKESAWMKSPNQDFQPIRVLALGGSVATNGLLDAEVVVFRSLDELRKAKRAAVEGKIVLLNQPMDDAQINTFKAYGACYAIRGQGAVEAAKLGAVAVLVRSLNLMEDEHPHTGSMHYEDGVARIPAAAIATAHADLLAEQCRMGGVRVALELNCQNHPPVASYNVIAEVRGQKLPHEYIVFGGHLDSWDVGEGAHDDGAGIVHTMEALRLLVANGYRPNRTLRVVFFMNEENGNMGGKTYASWVKERGENHVLAIESDRGGFAPRGFSCDGTAEQVQTMQRLVAPLRQYELHDFEKGYGGVDINPLRDYFPGIALFGFVPDSQRYFDFHHAETDVFEVVHKRELELGCAAIASFVYLLDQYWL